MAVVTGMAIPAFRAATSIPGRKGGVAIFLSVCEQARALAMSEAKPVFIVFPDEQATEKYRNRSLAIYMQDESGKRTRVSKWYYLPSGVAFKNEVFSLLQQGKDENKSDFPVTDDVFPETAESKGLHYLQFDEMGMVAAPLDSNYLKVFVFEGEVNSDGAESGRLFEPALASFVGGAASSKRSKHDDRSVASLYFDEIKISKFSGRARWTTPLPQ